MPDRTDLVDLARELGEIAGTTADPETGRRLAELVERMLEKAGLPPDIPRNGSTMSLSPQPRVNATE